MQGLNENPSKAALFPVDPLTQEAADAYGVSVGSLEPGEILTVQTRNTRYDFTIVDPDKRLAMVQGGSVFPEPTEVVIKGSTAGGCAIKLGWIGVGLYLEMIAGPRRITTSRVQSVLTHSFHPDSLPMTA